MLVNGARGCPLCAAINYASIRLGHEYMCDRWLEHWQTAAQYLWFGTVHMIETCDFYLKNNQTLIIDFQGTRFLTGHNVMIKIVAVWCNLKNIVGVHGKTATAWWRHQMETFSALLAICAGNSPVTGEIPTQKPMTRSFDIFLDLRLNKRLSKQWWGWRFEMPLRPLWRDRNVVAFLV